MWFLEMNALNRAKVNNYFSDGFYNNNELTNRVLRKLCTIICSLEVANEFVEGLKFFIPVVGCWDNEGIGSIDISILRHFLSSYISIHLSISSKPLFPSNENPFQNISTVVDISLSILNIMSLHKNHANQESLLMSDFCNSLRAMLSKSPLNLSLKVMTDLFVSATSGRPIMPLTIPPDTPSFLFSLPVVMPLVPVSIPHITNGHYSAVLTRDAVYLIDQEASSKSAGCIPLSLLKAGSGDGKPQTMELFGEKATPLILPLTSSDTDIEVSYHESILIRFESDDKEIHLHWMDVINSIGIAMILQ